MFTRPFGATCVTRPRWVAYRPFPSPKYSRPNKELVIYVDTKQTLQAGEERNAVADRFARGCNDWRYCGDRPTFLSRKHHRESGRHAPLFAARTGRTRHLYP